MRETRCRGNRPVCRVRTAPLHRLVFGGLVESAVERLHHGVELGIGHRADGRIAQERGVERKRHRRDNESSQCEQKEDGFLTIHDNHIATSVLS